MTPGATTAVVVRSTLSRGWRGGLAAAAGAACGNTTQALAAILVVSTIFARWPLAAPVLRGAGAGFLLWLGVKSVLNSSRMNNPGSETDRGYSSGKNFREGFTVNVLNPAITTFYVAVVPSFMPPGAGRGYYALLCAAHIVIAFGCHASWAAIIHGLKRHTQRPRARQMLEIATGLVLIAVAAQVLLSQ